MSDHLKDIKFCEMLVGDKNGPKGRCDKMQAMTAWFNLRQYRVCQEHGAMLREMELTRLTPPQPVANA
jgi:hypothetical protein